MRAAQVGMTLLCYLLSGIEQIAEKPSLRGMLERLSKEKPVELDKPPKVAIRRHRGADGDVG